MNVDEIKNIFYFVFAVLWFVFSVYINNKNKKNKSLPKQKPIPNIFDEEIKEFKKVMQEVSSPTQVNKTSKPKKTKKKTYIDEIPEEVIKAQKRKIQRENAMKKSRNKKFEGSVEDPENENALLDSLDFKNTDLQKMVIFTEIFKRPNY